MHHNDVIMEDKTLSAKLKVSLIGLDTSHSVEFAKNIQSPDCPEDQKIEGLDVISCLRFSTPFQSEEGLNQREQLLTSWGINVTRDFNEAVDGCDAIMLEINDPSLHLEYFRKCAELGLPVFLDKPMADNLANAKEIYAIAKDHKMRVFTASPLRFGQELINACETIPNPAITSVYGPVATAPAGSSIVWYGVHAVEMLQKAMGRGAVSVVTFEDKTGYVIMVEYGDGRRGVVELVKDNYSYGGCLRNNSVIAPYTINNDKIYPPLLCSIRDFLHGGEPPVDLVDSLEIMAILDGADKSAQSGMKEYIRIDKYALAAV